MLIIHEYKGWPAFGDLGVRLDARVLPTLCFNKAPSCFFVFPAELREPSTVRQKALGIIHQVQSSENVRKLL